MNVELRCFGPVREAVGAKNVTRELPEGATVADLLSGLVEDAPELEGQLVDEAGEVSGSINVTVDGDNVRQLDGATTTLSDGDVVRIAPPVVGGDGRVRGRSAEPRAAQSSATAYSATAESGTVPSSFQPRSS